jgi:amino acid adenylation domain-containing protein
MVLPAGNEEDSIYIYFTSGSTGRPKGIVGRNGSLRQFLEWETGCFSVDETYRFSQFVSPYFDAFLRDVFTPLVAGGEICIPTDEIRNSPEMLVSWIDETGITLIHCVPGFFRYIQNGLPGPRCLKGLRYVLLSGERIVPADLARWYALLGQDITMVNLYGPTETTMIRSFYIMGPGDVEMERIPVGRAIAGSELIVADEHLNPCGTLVPGEIVVLSEYTTLGYLNDPVGTNSRFHMLSGRNGSKPVAYRTGDVGRMLPDGQLDLIGRKDRQIKLQGIRVELDEIEAAIRRAEHVGNAAVVRSGENTDQDVLIAFVIYKGGQDEGHNESLLQAHLAGLLPVQIRPARIIAVTTFPLLPNGKMNYNQLLELLHRDQIVLSPKTAIEAELLAIWKEILGDKAISVTDGFQRSGGNSIGMMRLIGRIYKVFGVRVSLDQIFSNLTIVKQAVLIENAKRDELFRLHKAEQKPAYSLSAAQERLFYFYEMDKRSTAFNLPRVWEMDVSADIARIERVIRDLIERHESLRTEFVFRNGEVGLVIRNTVEFDLEEVVDETGSLTNLILRSVSPFDLGQAPLIRAKILRTGDHRRFLFLDMHHIVCDGMSQEQLIDEFLHLYHGGRLEALDLHYKDFTEWEKGFRGTEAYTSYGRFWHELFADGVPEVAWPILNTSRAFSNGIAGDFEFQVRRNTIDPLVFNEHYKDISCSSVFFALYMLLVFEITGQEDLVVGTNSAGKYHSEMEGVIGMFAKTLPIRWRIDPEQRFADFLMDFHAFLGRAYSNQLFDLADIHSFLKMRGDVTDVRLFDVMFVYLNAGGGRERETGNGVFKKVSFGAPESKYLLTLFVYEEKELFHFRWEYSLDRLTNSDVDYLTSRFLTLLEKALPRPRLRIGELVKNEMIQAGPDEDRIKFDF